MRPATPEAVNLMLQGAIALAAVEHHGIRIDVEYLEQTIADTERKITALTEQLQATAFYRDWQRHYGDKTKLGSRQQLASLLFDEMKIPYPHDFTRTNKYRADEEVLKAVDHPFVRDYLRLDNWKRFLKVSLLGLRAETVDGFVHPFFHLHTVETYRGCLAKGTMIEIVRDVSKDPKGVPIQEVCKGDWVYCYDNDLNMTLRKVVWAGKTGRRRVIRIHWSARGKKGHLDLTPEHRVRMASGKYVMAQNLEGGDYRSKNASKHAPKLQVLAMGRKADGFYQTGDTELIYDHRFIYRELVGALDPNEVVHHKDGNHLNNLPANLEKMSLSDHSKLHSKEVLTDDVRRKAVRARVRNHELYGDRFASGSDCANWIELSKFGFLRMLLSCGGRIARMKHDFNTMRRKAVCLGIDLKGIKDRFDKEGNLITRGALLRSLERGGREGVRQDFGINFYKVKKLLTYRGFSTERRWGNQFGKFVPNNHKITKIEWVNRIVDVYDIKVDGCHNFIANELCVHNSSSEINFQNIPRRDEELGPLIRRAFIPRKGRVLVESDFGALEFRIAAAVWRDPEMIAYASDPSKDIHRDQSAACYRIHQDSVSKGIRDCGKNLMVFPKLYGSYYVQMAKNLWNAVGERDLKIADGTKLKQVLRAKGIRELGECNPRVPPRPGTFEHHMKAVEQDFEERFHVFTAGKDQWWSDYCKRGWFRLVTGFVIQGVYSRNFLMNAPIQGPGFHCLLWSTIEVIKQLRKRKMKSKIIGEIHDCMLGDVPVSELQDYLHLVKQVITVELPRAWSWIVVPLAIEAEVTPPEGSWADKQNWDEVNGNWQPRSKT